MSDYDGGFDERPHMSYTAQDALKARGEIVRKSYENKIERLKRKLAVAQAQRDKAVAALKYYLGAAEKREKKASAIINSLTADIHITLPFRNGTEMSPKDCYEQGVMDGVAALKSQINAAIDAAMGEKK